MLIIEKLYCNLYYLFFKIIMNERPEICKHSDALLRKTVNVFVQFFRQKLYKFQFKFFDGSEDLRQNLNFYIELKLYFLYVGT